MGRDTFSYARLLQASLKHENTLKKNKLHFKPTQPPYMVFQKKSLAFIWHALPTWSSTCCRSTHLCFFFFSPHIIKVTKETTQPSSVLTLCNTDTKQSTWHHFSHPPTPSRKGWSPTAVQVGGHQTPNALITGTQPHPLQQAPPAGSQMIFCLQAKEIKQWSLGSLPPMQLSSLEKTQWPTFVHSLHIKPSPSHN